jgi:hypothetical protein
MSDIVSVFHGTRSTTESASGKSFRARNAIVEAERIAALYEVREEDILASAQFAEAQYCLDLAQQLLSVTGHFPTAVKYATDSSDVVGLLLEAVQELRGEVVDQTSLDALISEHLGRYEGEPIVLEFQLPLAKLLAGHPSNEKGLGYARGQVAEGYSEFVLPEELAATSLTGTHWLSSDEYVQRAS